MRKSLLCIIFTISFLMVFFTACGNPLDVINQEKQKAKYEVHHLRENINNEYFDELEEEVEILEGNVGELTAAVTKEYPGFVAQYFQQKVIKPVVKVKEEPQEQEEEAAEREIRTVVTIHYYRVKYKYTFKDGDTVLAVIKGKYEADFPTTQIQNPTKENSVFENWDSAIPEKFTGDKTFTAVWRSSNENYLVLHRKQNINDNGYTVYEDETKSAPANRLTSATAKTYTGFTARDIEQQMINENGTTVVNVYYDRNVYTLSFNSNGGSSVASVRGKYGAAVPSITNPTKTGYVFNRWNPRLPETFSADSEYTAVWDPSTTTRFKVEHYLQSVNLADYVLDENQNLTGTTNELTTAAALEYKGFTAKNFSQVIIQPDGSSVVKIYYDRNLCEVTLYDGETVYRTMRGRYGAAFPTVNTPIKTGYTFNGWTPSLPSTYTTQTEYHMNWSPRTDIVYKVEHYQQNLDPSTGYTKLTRDNQTLTGTTGTLTQAEANEYEGFTVLEFDQVPIAGDGSTVVKIYYDRN